MQGFDAAVLADAIALIHTIDWPLAEPERLTRALDHLETTVALSRASWTAILAETDDRREWLPGPRQTGIIPSRPGGPPVAVSEAMIEEWFLLLDEVEAILAGRTLVPYWRVRDGRGVNVRRVLVEPRPFDLILWIQGAAVAPYLEEGTLSRGDTWRRIAGAFGGRFLPFAVWFN